MAINPVDMKRVMNNHHRLLAPVEKLLLKENDEKSSFRDKVHLHPSEICKKDWCPRSSYYRIIGKPEKPESFTLQKLNIFAEGTLIHEKWQKWLTKAGVLEQAEVPVIDVDHLIMGHADGVINDKHGRAVIEIKSVGVGTVRFEDYGLFAPYSKNEINLDQLWNSIKHPFDSHVRQAQLYMHCLGIHEGLILYEWKATQDVKEFAIQFQPELVAPILAACLSVKRALDSKTPPERPIWLTPESRVCKYCPFKEECWNATSSNSSENQSGRIPASQVSSSIRTSDEASGLDTASPGEFRRVIRQ